MSLFVPVHRFRCEQFACKWAGNLRVGEKSTGALVPTGESLFDPVPSRVPRTFICSMVLVAVGIVSIMLVPLANLGKDPQAYLAPSADEVAAAPKLKPMSAQTQRDAGPAGRSRAESVTSTSVPTR